MSPNGSDYGATAFADGVPAALARLLAEHPDWSPWGHRGYALVPEFAPRGTIVRTLQSDEGGLALCRDEYREHSLDPRWTAAVTGIRLGGAERLMRLCVQHLSRRTVQGRMTLAHPVVRAHFGEAVLDLAEARQCADLPAAGRTADAVVRATLRRFGAAGYVDGPARRLARALDLLSDLYREGGPDHAGR
ncbi:hypothetical protein [Glycomyces paridis]|uniref:Acyl-CoA dehydrogenase/oxidase C-terminal domain-containing protein n=1 Tax=Glycomyces paridis TaxID=2126555 RepID=A0A4S8PHZ3_9ACTN|nr:hypothetical protein [Glycomyces paridis]THV30227.1 hypothetical protein E9998_07600 [Glycomyces paridis]